MDSREIAILVTLVAYKIVLLAFGLIGRRRTQDAADFYVGGYALGPVVAAVSASASSSSAWTILGVSGAAYAWGFGALWLFPACVGGFLLNWVVLAPGLRRDAQACGAVTVTDLLARSAGSHAGLLRRLASLIVLVSLLVYVSSQLQGAGKTFGATFDMEPTPSILLGAGIVVAYTLLGGFWAVSLTDTLQGILMALTSIALPVAALIEVGGPGALMDGLAQLDPEFVSVVRGWEPAVGIGFVAGLFGIGLGYPGQPHVVNRLMALKDDAGSLPRARAVAMTWAVIVYAGMLILGWCGRLLYPTVPDGETVFILATNGLFPPVVAGVMLAAVLSAIMSTADSQLLVAGSAVTHDLGLGGRDDASMLRRSRGVVLGLGAAATVAAVLADESIFSKVLFAWGALGAAFGPLLLVTVLRGPVPGGRAVAAMLSGCLLSVIAYYLTGTVAEAFGGPVDSWKWLEQVVPYVVAFAVLLAPGGRARA